MIGWNPSRARAGADDAATHYKTPPEEVSDQFYQARKKLADEARKLPQGAMGPFLTTSIRMFPSDLNLGGNARCSLVTSLRVAETTSG